MQSQGGDDDRHDQVEALQAEDDERGGRRDEVLEVDA